jgi:hypothetical protein
MANLVPWHFQLWKCSRIVGRDISPGLFNHTVRVAATITLPQFHEPKSGLSLSSLNLLLRKYEQENLKWASSQMHHILLIHNPHGTISSLFHSFYNLVQYLAQ